MRKMGGLILGVLAVTGLTKEEQDYKENMNEAVDNALLPDIHSDEEVR